MEEIKIAQTINVIPKGTMIDYGSYNLLSEVFSKISNCNVTEVSF